MPVEWSVLVATESDLPALQGLFANAFPNSRFRAPYFTPEENRRFYQEWITKAVRGEFDDVCLVQRATNGEIKGGITLRKCDNDMRVGLLAVAPKYRGCGVAKALLRSAYRWGQEYNAEKLYVATQTGNLAAIRLYGSVGAKICATNYWFYRVQK
jgi:dTDP-4-amino-4,6-dideoxy-D-galactose acyltransferase